MSQYDLIQLKIHTLREGLERARAAMPLVADLDHAVGQRVTELFQVRVDQVQEAFGDLGDDDEKLSLTVARAEELLEEALAYLTAACVRKTGMDGGTTDLALIWLDQLSKVAQLPPVAVVIPALEESTRTTSTVIRLRLPSDGIWGLPVAIHEFGHFAAARLTQVEVDGGGGGHPVLPVEQLVYRTSEKAELPQLYLHGHELFADAFGAAVAGPAYPRYCLRYRFPFAEAHKEKATHPTSARRMRLQIRVLEALSRHDSDGFLRGETKAVERSWADGVHAAGLSPDVPENPVLDELENNLLQIVLDHDVIRRMHYREHTVASELAANDLVTRQSPAAAQVVNAAWDRRTQIERSAGTEGFIQKQLATLAERAIGLLKRGEGRG
jgi:hypothetical protein